jgi:hypothetical protein
VAHNGHLFNPTGTHFMAQANTKRKGGVTYLNVDDLAPAKKTLTLKGKVHEMHQVSVSEFIAVTKASKDIDEKDFDELKVDEKMERLVVNVSKAFPTIPDEDLGALSLEQLTAIIRFAAGTLAEEAGAVAAAESEQAAESEGEEKNG